MTAEQIANYLQTFLNVDRFRDYCPNGLQVAGTRSARRLVAGVTVNLALIDAAVAADADAILVHHGLFWKGDDPCLVGWRRRRVERLLQSGISLLAYHLPLDAHPEIGNNARLGQILGLETEGQCGEQDLVCWSRLPETPLEAFTGRVGNALGRKPLVIGGDGRPLRCVAWCTGAAQSGFEAAIAAGADAYVTGEISEQYVHIARETGVSFIAAGHHATERYGVQALAAHLVEKFAIEAGFIDIDSPV